MVLSGHCCQCHATTWLTNWVLTIPLSVIESDPNKKHLWFTLSDYLSFETEMRNHSSMKVPYCLIIDLYTLRLESWLAKKANVIKNTISCTLKRLVMTAIAYTWKKFVASFQQKFNCQRLEEGEGQVQTKSLGIPRALGYHVQRLANWSKCHVSWQK